MYVKILDTGKGFETYQEQVDAGMELYHIRDVYYELKSVLPTPAEICNLFGYVPVTEAEVFPPSAPEAPVEAGPSLADRLTFMELQNAEYAAIIEDAIMRGVL